MSLEIVRSLRLLVNICTYSIFDWRDFINKKELIFTTFKVWTFELRKFSKLNNVIKKQAI